MEAQFADVIDDRFGARVSARCWAVAGRYLTGLVVGDLMAWQDSLY
jgi:hypothetical protein